MEDPRINVVSLTVRRRTVWDVKCYRVNMGVFGREKKKKDSVEIYSCNTTKTTEIIAEENLHPWWGTLEEGAASSLLFSFRSHRKHANEEIKHTLA